KGGRVGEGDLGIADFDDRKQIDNLKLVDWIDSHDYSSFNCLSRTTPAARITFSTPAAKPSSRNTVSPHGEVPSQRSSSQPIAAPTRTPPTSSVDSRKPRPIAEVWTVCRGPKPFSDGRFACASRLPSRCSLAERTASSSGGSLRLSVSRAPSTILFDPRGFLVSPVPPT